MMREQYLFEDPAAAAIPAQNSSLRIDSHGSRIFGRVLMPGVDSPEARTPAVVFLHGYPGVEKNLDIPQALRRTGVATVEFSYRGVWGSHGYYCLSHLIEDAETVLAYLRANADTYRIDPERIYLVGHSMGGFTAVNVLARGAAVRGAVIMAPCDIGYCYEEDPEDFADTMKTQEHGFFAVPHENYIREDAEAHAAEWRFIRLADKLTSVPIRFIGGTQDTAVPVRNHIFPLLEKLRELGADADYTEFDDGHAFPAHRIALTRMIYRYIEEMERNN